MEFIRFVVERVNNSNRIKCPCIRCGCLENVTVKVLSGYLFFNRIDKGYTRWIWHGESARDRPINSDDRKCDERERVNCSEDDKLEDMIYDVENHFMDRPNLIQRLKDDAEKFLYVGCSKFTTLSAVLRSVSYTHLTLPTKRIV